MFVTPIFFGNIDSYTIAEVAEALRVDESTVRHWIKAGELKSFSASLDAFSQRPRLRVFEDEVKAFAQRRQHGTPPKPTRRQKKRPDYEQIV